MAARRRESGEARQERIKRMQHRPEQNRGYDEAVRGGSGAADDRSARDVPTTADSTAESRNDADDREARTSPATSSSARSLGVPSCHPRAVAFRGRLAAF